MSAKTLLTCPKFQIVSIVATTGTIIATGNAEELAGRLICLAGTTVDDGVWTCTTAVYSSPNTTIVVEESLPDDDAGGSGHTINLCREVATDADWESGDPPGDGDSIVIPAVGFLIFNNSTSVFSIQSNSGGVVLFWGGANNSVVTSAGACMFANAGSNSLGGTVHVLAGGSAQFASSSANNSIVTAAGACTFATSTENNGTVYVLAGGSVQFASDSINLGTVLVEWMGTYTLDVGGTNYGLIYYGPNPAGVTTATAYGIDNASNGTLNMSLYETIVVGNGRVSAQLTYDQGLVAGQAAKILVGTNFGAVGNPVGTYVAPVQAQVLRPADGGTAYGAASGTNGTYVACPQASALYSGTAYYGIAGALVDGTWKRPNSGSNPYTFDVSLMTTAGYCGVANASQGSFDEAARNTDPATVTGAMIIVAGDGGIASIKLRNTTITATGRTATSDNVAVAAAQLAADTAAVTADQNKILASASHIVSQFGVTGTAPAGYGGSLSDEQIAAIGDAAGESVAGAIADDPTIAAIGAKCASIGAGTVTTVSAVTDNLDLNLTQYDTYAGGGWAAPSFTNTAGTWANGNLTDWTITLTVRDKLGGLVLQAPGTMDTATGTQVFHVDLPTAETGLLTLGGRQCQYDVLIEKNGVRETILRGYVIANKTLAPPT